MTTYAEMTEKATAQLLEAVKPVEEMAKSFAAQTIESVGKLPALPTVEGLPSPLEVVTAHFALAEKLLGAQKDFAVRLASSAKTSPVKAASKS
jgi:cell division septum initiation protein DivIVA